MENKDLPQEIEQMDVVILEKLQLKEENLQLRAAVLQQAMVEAQKELAAHREKLKAKYQLADSDTIDSNTLKITRKE